MHAMYLLKVVNSTGEEEWQSADVETLLLLGGCRTTSTHAGDDNSQMRKPKEKEYKHLFTKLASKLHHTGN